jgi:hypothetical protein
MLPFETFDPMEPAAPALVQLPFYVEPKPDEVMLSWLLRLAVRLQVSLHTLVRGGFWIDDRRERAHWWRRPEPQMISRISTRTGISTERLRAMTFERWTLSRDDEANERFSAERFRQSAPRQRGFRYVQCEACVDADGAPHVRVPWAIGWVAVCPEHRIVMIAQCQRCRASLRFGRPAMSARFSPMVCTLCGHDLRYELHQRAHPVVLRLQESLIDAKSRGATELTGLGRMSWEQIIALFDVVLGMFWTDTKLVEQQRTHALFQKDYPTPQAPFFNTRYPDLAFLAWLTEGWPRGPGPQIAMDMLSRWLSGKPNRIFRHLGVNWSDPWNPEQHDVPEQRRARLRQLLNT